MFAGLKQPVQKICAVMIKQLMLPIIVVGVKEVFLADIRLTTDFLLIRSWLRWNMLTPSRKFRLAYWRKISLQESRFGYVIDEKLNRMVKFRSHLLFSGGLGLYSSALGARERRRGTKCLLLSSRFVDMRQRYSINVDCVLFPLAGWYMQQSKMQNHFEAERQ